MITRMDREIGRVVDQLKKMDAFRDTLILFLSDNGASSEQLIRADGHDASAPPGSGASHLCLGPGWSSASNTPFRLHKSWVHEGGISSPLVAHWPAGIREAGKVRHTPCHFIDVVPTLVDLAGGKDTSAGEGAPPLPVFRKDGTVERDHLYFNHSNNRAIRMGDMKLVAAGQDGPWELYDLSRDRCEQNNLAARHPDKVRQMAERWTQLDEDFVHVREAAPASAKARM